MPKSKIRPTPKPQGSEKLRFHELLSQYVETLREQVTTADGQWTVKGFIDVFKNIYTISADTKVVSKILEIHLIPRLMEFAANNGFRLVLADHQNYYPDLTFVSMRDANEIYAVDIKTTFRRVMDPAFCNGFTLGSHGAYFIDRSGKKNIQFPYEQYKGHFCLCIIYTRNMEATAEKRIEPIANLKSIASVITNVDLFISEKWAISSDLQGSSNTANMASIMRIADLKNGNGIFKNLGEHWFDDYWINYGKVSMTTPDGR